MRYVAHILEAPKMPADLAQMLSGFNCTIFAYGQTGTGKTYTMSGDMSETYGLLSDAAGIIPRVLQSLFNKLEIDDTENCVRCSFIELYNEELRDLLSADEGAKLKIFDDNSRKGHATTVVQGVEERHITNAADGIKRLQEGSIRRQVAATKCNDLSSRSHTVFTITVHIKRTLENGEDFVSTGKLNLVDLAGSENIQRSGAENKRAAEAGLINKSLLTLGRVINALVDKSSHVPYRESKLTRLLQDSLGGRTKTCIIATISPAKSNLEETISTLDYAFRAKNIRNKPQINQLINKKTLLREFTGEIEKLKTELIATRQRNGVYLSNEAYEEVTAQNESRRILNEEQAAKIETMETNLRNKVQELFDLTSSFMGMKKEHEGTRAQLDETKEVLDQTELVLAATRKTLAEETHVRRAHQETEEKLANLGSELISTLRQAVDDVGGMRAKSKRKSDLQSLNRGMWTTSQAQVADVTELVESHIEDFRRSQDLHISSISGRMQSFVESELSKLSSTQAFLDENLSSFELSRQELLQRQNKSKEDMDDVLEEIKAVRDHIKERVGESLQAIASAAERIAADVLSELGDFRSQVST
jgi:kinesin family member 11